MRLRLRLLESALRLLWRHIHLSPLLLCLLLPIRVAARTMLPLHSLPARLLQQRIVRIPHLLPLAVRLLHLIVAPLHLLLHLWCAVSHLPTPLHLLQSRSTRLGLVSLGQKLHRSAEPLRTICINLCFTLLHDCWWYLDGHIANLLP